MKRMNASIKAFIKKGFSAGKADLLSAFIKCLPNLAEPSGQIKW